MSDFLDALGSQYFKTITTFRFWSQIPENYWDELQLRRTFRVSDPFCKNLCLKILCIPKVDFGPCRVHDGHIFPF